MRPDARGQAWWWPVGPALCAGLAAVPALDVVALAPSGLALLTVGVVFAVFLGTSLAREDWSAEPDRSPAERWATGLADTALFGSVAVGLAAWSPGPGWSVVAWGIAALGSVLGARAGLLGLAVWAILVAAAGRMGAEMPPWSLLEPAYGQWQTWLSSGLAMGALASWGAGQWRTSAAPQPGRHATPNLAAGLALLALVGGAIAVGAGWEASMGGRPPSPVVGLMCACGTAGALAVLLRPPTTGWRAGVTVAGVVATWWFAGPAASTRWTWWAAELPVLLGSVALLRAWASRDARWAVAGIVLCGAAVVSFPGVPRMVVPAAATAVPLVLAVWFAGTRAVLEERAA